MDLHSELHYRTVEAQTRRHFLGHCGAGLGGLWLAQQALSPRRAKAETELVSFDPLRPAAPRAPHFAAKVKRVIVIHLSGAPSHLDLFDYKPELAKYSGQDCPERFLEGKRFAFIRGTPQLLGPVYPFHQEAKTGHWISDRLPHLEQSLDKICFLHSMQSEQFNHAPAQLLAFTGNANPGYASFGAWTLYGLGSESENLPGFVVLISGGQNPDGGKALWSSAFLPSVFQGVQCRSQGDPVLFLSDPPGVSRKLRGEVVQAINQLNQQTHAESGDPETLTRIAQYEMAFRMQMAASEAMNMADEPEHVHKLYNTQPGKEAFANNCLLARRLMERGVRFVQLFDWGWDHHDNLETNLPNKSKEVDQPVAALLQDLEQRGLLEDTLVVWAAEFGRTPMQENRGGVKAKTLGRDHHPDAFTIWLAGGGIKGGHQYGSSDEIGFRVGENPVQWADVNATLLHLLGLDHHKLAYPFQGLDQKLVGVKPCRVIEEILA
ncbi:MAG: DUF1501 domain-containing protein [Pirellulales bacterium]